MKRVIKYFSFGLMAVLALSACSDQFLEDKKNYDNATTDIYNYLSGCQGRVNDIYSWCLPTTGDLSTGQNYLSVATGAADIAGKSTEEYYGFSDFVNPEIELTSMDDNPVPDYFMGSNNNIQTSVYGRIRNINDCINGILNGSLSEEEKQVLLGQVYFFRAWCYYNLVKWYGGVPIVDKVLDPVESSYTPRSTTKETFEFILADLDRASNMLAKETMNGGWSGSDYGRVTTGTALALKGRVLLLWASPLFNRTNDVSRWQTAYTQMKQELDSINRCGYSLYHTGNNVNGSDFAKQFLTVNGNPEAVFVTLYNNIASDEGLDNQKNNRWERDIRPANTGGGGKNAGLALIELFPMADGKIPNLSTLTALEKAGTRSYVNTYSKLERSQYDYDESAPYMNRDPRFYRTFAFPGFRWAYDGDPTQRDGHNPSYNGGKDYVLWNYKWYVEASAAGNPENGNSYSADNLYTSNVGVYVRKKSDDYDLGAPLYNYGPLASKGAGPFFSQAPLIELRYAEVLLNLAEAACGAGQMAEAVQYLQQIRARAGYTAANNYGLQANLTGDQAACMSAILYERMIEFAYEGKRFDDLRRWMLFDGGTQLAEGAPSTWQMTGWGGNTCTWLGFTPLNGQRRERIEFRTGDQYGVGTAYWDGDPMANVERPAGIDFREADIESQLSTLKDWYNTNLVTQYKNGDGQDSQHNLEYMRFLPKYYFLGLSSGAQNSNKGLPQTIGWKDYNNGGAPGTFDPLAE